MKVVSKVMARAVTVASMLRLINEGLKLGEYSSIRRSPTASTTVGHPTKNVTIKSF